MQNALRNIARLLVVASTVTIAGAANPQQPEPKAAATPKPVPQSTQVQTQAATEAPQRTTATYADWVVQCETRPGPPSEKACNMVQATQMQGKNQLFSRVAIDHPVKGQPVKLVIQVPVNVSISPNVRIQTGDADPGYAVPFARCLPVGCLAGFDLKDDMLKKFRAATGAGKLSYRDAAAHEVAIPLSFNGFNQAFDALAKE
jgi:invasion protein IalB